MLFMACVGLSEGEREFTGGEAALLTSIRDAPPVQEFTHEKLMHTITYDKHRKTNSFTLSYIL